MKDDVISRQAVIAEFNCCELTPDGGIDVNDAIDFLKHMPSAQPDIAEKLYQYKCYITDKDGLQHEVIHIDDIRRVTGWMI